MNLLYRFVGLPWSYRTIFTDFYQLLPLKMIQNDKNKGNFIAFLYCFTYLIESCLSANSFYRAWWKNFHCPNCIVHPKKRVSQEFGHGLKSKHLMTRQTLTIWYSNHLWRLAFISHNRDNFPQLFASFNSFKGISF